MRITASFEALDSAPEAPWQANIPRFRAALAAAPRGVRVYLAGKIAKNCWRNQLFPGLRCDPRGLPHTGQFTYVGPFFIGCDHGGFHGQNTHGVGQGEAAVCCPNRSLGGLNVVAACTEWIRAADVVFVWLDDKTAYGTITEIGTAAALGKPIFVATPSLAEFADLWFCFALAIRSGGRVEQHATPESAWARFEEWSRDHLEAARSRSR